MRGARWVGGRLPQVRVRIEQEETGESFDEAIRSFLKEERPTLELKRRGEPDEVAAAVLFLLSKNATFITGANLRIDGGSVATV